MEGSVAANEITITMKDGKRQLRRIIVEGQAPDDALSGLLARSK